MVKIVYRKVKIKVKIRFRLTLTLTPTLVREIGLYRLAGLLYSEIQTFVINLFITVIERKDTLKR